MVIAVNVNEKEFDIEYNLSIIINTVKKLLGFSNQSEEIKKEGSFEIVIITSHLQEAEVQNEESINNINENTNDNITAMLGKIKKIVSKVEKNNILNEEYYDYVELDRIINNIFEKDISSIKEEEVTLLSKILIEFIKITDFKLNIYSTYGKTNKELVKSKFKKEYINFSRNFFKLRMNYYSEMYESNKKHDDTVQKLLDEIAPNILKE
ncbi:hypothetical protein [Methanobrevibacter sp. DSM 116169]|uniref:hypothetical protein n=1 Tax=Methanobrevibacter sp. DSM 116169 TaxID=3242727 RepID=UPI0038FC76E4